MIQNVFIFIKSHVEKVKCDKICNNKKKQVKIQIKMKINSNKSKTSIFMCFAFISVNFVYNSLFS